MNITPKLTALVSLPPALPVAIPVVSVSIPVWLPVNPASDAELFGREYVCVCDAN